MKKLFDSAFGFLIMAGLVLFLAVMGMGMVATGTGERKLAEAPEVTLPELAGHAGKTVRVRARLVGAPALQASGGEALAFQAVTITHEESSGSGEDYEVETVTDYAAMAPQVLVASDGEASAGIVAAGVDLRFVPERFEGRTGRGGVFPAEAAALLAANTFAGLPDRSDTDLSIRAIREGEEVTIHGTVEVVDGQPVLRAPADLPFVVSPLPFDEVVKQANTSGIISLVFGWAMLLGAAALAFFGVRGWLRGRRASAQPAAAA